jgi:ribose 5-phosphate isomerase A
MLRDTETWKQAAAEMAVDFVRSGMVIGLGAGTTALVAVSLLGKRIQSGFLVNILGVPCSLATEQAAIQLGIPLTTLQDHPVIDLTIDGADEVDPHLDLIKGGGGALLREKIVAQASLREVIIVDESKLSTTLGTNKLVPVEVIPFGWGSQAVFLESLGAHYYPRQKEDGNLFQTDQGNLILDCDFGPIPDPVPLAGKLDSRAGIVAHGLFIGLASDVIVGGMNGCRHLTRMK